MEPGHGLATFVAAVLFILTFTMVQFEVPPQNVKTETAIVVEVLFCVCKFWLEVVDIVVPLGLSYV